MAYDELQLRRDIDMLRLKASQARLRSIKARDAAGLAVEYAIDCETLAARMLSSLTKNPA